MLALAFLAVGREGVETALFMVGYAEAKTAWPLIGLDRRRADRRGHRLRHVHAARVRINLAKFFKYTGAFLIVVAAGILSYGIGALQTVGWLPGLAHKAFDISSWFNWSSWYGEVIQGVFNVTPDADRAAVRGWLAYLVIVLGAVPAPDRGAREAGADPAADSPPSAPIRPRVRSRHHIRKVHHVNVSPCRKGGAAAAAACWRASR